MLVQYEPILDKIRYILDRFGTKSTIITDRVLDFEHDFGNAFNAEGTSCICGVGTLQLFDAPIDYIHVLKQQKLESCGFMPGGSIGMGRHLHTWYKTRYFLSFPNEIQIGPLDIGTVTTIKQGRFTSKVEEFFWNGYGKLTTLPPGILRDNIIEMLGADSFLNDLMLKNLIKEGTIKIKKYSSRIQTKEKQASITNSKIVIESNWKLQKDILSERNQLEMYYNLAFIIKTAVNNLRYHLSKY